MSPILVSDKGNNFPTIPLPEAGTVQAVCCAVWDIGLQPGYQGGAPKRKVVIAWEIDQVIDVPESEYNGQPYMLTRRYTASLNEKATLRRDLEAWRGRPFTAEESANFDIEKLVGANCLLGVTHIANAEGRTFANITSILPLPKNMQKIVVHRAADAEPPKWVKELQANQVVETAQVRPDANIDELNAALGNADPAEYF